MRLQNPSTVPARARGVSLIELMVALVIGSILVLGAITVFIDSRATYRVNQSVSRMQENGVFALDEIARSLQLAGYWGENNTANRVVGRTIRSGGNVSTASPLADAANECRADWYTDLERPVEGLDATLTAPGNDAHTTYATCIPDAQYQLGTDILVVRHVEPNPVPTASLQAHTAYMRADPNQAEMFIGATEPSGFASTAANYQLVATAFYVSSFTNAAGDGIPSLKRATLRTGAGGAPLVYVPGAGDEQDVVVSGIENLQVQFGVDTDSDGSANQYLNADNVAATEWDNVTSVRIWLVVRAAATEQNFINGNTYGTPQGNFGQADAFRRLLLTRTVQIRN